jgi:hypothetical protein
MEIKMTALLIVGEKERSLSSIDWNKRGIYEGQ